MQAKMITQTLEYTHAAKGMFMICADTVAELNALCKSTDGEIAVITIQDGGELNHVGYLACLPEEWQNVCQVELDDSPCPSDWDKAEETVYRVDGDCEEHRLAVVLSGVDWAPDGAGIIRYACPECGEWYGCPDSAERCCD